MKILMSGDFHLDRLTAGYDRYQDTSNQINGVVNAAIRKRVDLFIFLGDLTDPDNVRSHRAVAAGIRTARALAGAGIQSMWLVGNHDVINDGSEGHTLLALQAAGYNVISEPLVSERYERPIAVLPYPAAGAAYDPAEFIEQTPELAEQPVLVVGHLSMAGATAGSESGELARGRDYAWPVEAIRKRWPRAIMVGGHYHRRHDCGGVSFAGSLERLAFDEELNQPGYLLLEV